MLTLLKGTLTTGGSVSLVAAFEGRWGIVLFAAPPLVLCGFNLFRLRGKRAEGPP